MFDLLARLRQRPEKDRRRIAFISALSITGLIILIWALSLVFVRPSVVTDEDASVTSPTESVWHQLTTGMQAFIRSITD